MKNYELFEKETNERLSLALNDLLVTSVKYGTGNITDARLTEIELDTEPQDVDIYITVKFDTCEKTFLLRTALQSKAIEIALLSIDVDKVLEEMLPTFESRLEELRNQDVERREEEAKERARQEAELKFQIKKEKMLAKLNELKPENTRRLFTTPMSYYETLGWMAKHITSIKPSMPDLAEKWFVGIFGDVENRYVVDSRKRTSGGFPMQWGLSCKISFDQEVVGPLAKRATSSNKRVIDNVAFVWDLIEKYGFQFGKKQDVDLIRKEIPTKYLLDFERGYLM